MTVHPTAPQILFKTQCSGFLRLSKVIPPSRETDSKFNGVFYKSRYSEKTNVEKKSASSWIINSFPSFLLFFISSFSWMYEQWMLPNTYTFPFYSPWSNISIQLQDLITLGKKRPEVSKKAPGGNQEQWMPWTQGSTPFSGRTSPNPADLGKANVWAPFLQMTLKIFPSWLPQENNIAVNRLLKIFFLCVCL